MSTSASHAHLFAAGTSLELRQLLVRLERFRTQSEICLDVAPEPEVRGQPRRFELFARGSPRDMQALRAQLLKRTLVLDLRYAEHDEAECAAREAAMGLRTDALDEERVSES